jgi:hypothetical protein
MIIKVDKILLDSQLAAGMIGGVRSQIWAHVALERYIRNRQRRSVGWVWCIRLRSADFSADYIKTGRASSHRLRWQPGTIGSQRPLVGHETDEGR